MKKKYLIPSLSVLLCCLYFFACSSYDATNKKESPKENTLIGEVKTENKGLRAGVGFDQTKLKSTDLKLPNTFYKRLKGTIGDDLEITVHLMKVGQMLLGNYHYDRLGKILKFNAESNIDDQQNLVLIEYLLNKYGLPKVTGTFNGKMLTNSTLKGNWQRPDSTSMPFVLKEKYDEKSAKLAVEQTEKKLGNCEIEDCLTISLIYPKIETLPMKEEQDATKKITNINQQINSVIAEQLFRPNKSKLHYLPLAKVVDTLVFFYQKNLEKKKSTSIENRRWDYEVKTDIFANCDDILSLGMSIYSYTGGEEPRAAYKCLNIDMASGKPIRLDNLLTANYLRPLTKATLNALKANEGLGEEEKLEDNNFLVADHEFNLTSNFCLTKGGITFFYNPHQLVDRPTVLEVFVPYEAVEEWIKKESLLDELVTI